MDSIKELFELKALDNYTGVQYKNNLIKREIVAHMAVNGESTIASLAKHINISVPSVTKLLLELVADRVVSDNGKITTVGGRRPNIYGLAGSSLYFMGVNICFDGLAFVITDIHGNIIESKIIDDFELVDTVEAFERVCTEMDLFMEQSTVEKRKIIGLGLSVAGRINTSLGVSYKFFSCIDEQLVDYFERTMDVRVIIENDARAKCYAEFFKGGNRPNNAIFLEFGTGVAIGIIVNGELCYGNSGFAGEFGHTPFFDNDVLCHCGKKGCFETEVSGAGIERKMNQKLGAGQSSKLSEAYKQKGRVNINEIIDAALDDDNLAVETLIEVSDKMGRGVAYVLNIFNPEVVTIGGCVARAGDHILLPVKSAASKYSVKLVFNDTKFNISEAGIDASALGAAMLVRKNILGL